MKTARVYRHSDARQAIALHLEAPDLFGLLLLFGILLVVQRHAFFLNLAFTAVAYLALRVAKRGKPAGYTTALTRYSVRALAGRLFLSGARPDLVGRTHPFQPLL